jgi:hypothetical protein
MASGTISTSLVKQLDIITMSFPFDQSSDFDVIRLFESSDFSLGKTELKNKLFNVLET